MRLLLLILALALVACSAPASPTATPTVATAAATPAAIPTTSIPPATQDALIGIWMDVSQPGRIFATFKPEGIVVYEAVPAYTIGNGTPVMGTPMPVATGTWKRTGEQKLEMAINGQAVSVTATIEGNNLTLAGSTGEPSRYVRK